jgi:hypothetical protein
MNRSLGIVRIILGIALMLFLAACTGPSFERSEAMVQDVTPTANSILGSEGGPGSTTLGVAEVTYKSWSCQEGLILFREAQIGNKGEDKTRYYMWLSPIPCESADRVLEN